MSCIRRTQSLKLNNKKGKRHWKQCPVFTMEKPYREFINEIKQFEDWKNLKPVPDIDNTVSQTCNDLIISLQIQKKGLLVAVVTPLEIYQSFLTIDELSIAELTAIVQILIEASGRNPENYLKGE